MSCVETRLDLAERRDRRGIGDGMGGGWKEGREGMEDGGKKDRRWMEEG